MKFVAVEVSRKQFSSVYIAVPDDAEIANNWKAIQALQVQQAVDSTLDSFDWETDVWNGAVDVEGVKEVTEAEASQYKTWDSTTGQVMP